MSLLEQHPTSPPELRVINGYHSHHSNPPKNPIQTKSVANPKSDQIQISPKQNGRAAVTQNPIENGHLLGKKISGRKGSGKSAVSNENQELLNGRNDSSQLKNDSKGSHGEKSVEGQNLSLEGTISRFLAFLAVLRQLFVGKS